MEAHLMINAQQLSSYGYIFVLNFQGLPTKAYNMKLGAIWFTNGMARRSKADYEG